MFSDGLCECGQPRRRLGMKYDFTYYYDIQCSECFSETQRRQRAENAVDEAWERNRGGL